MNESAVEALQRGRWRGTPYDALTRIGRRAVGEVVRGFDPELDSLVDGRREVAYLEGVDPEVAARLVDALAGEGFVAHCGRADVMLARTPAVLKDSRSLLERIRDPAIGSERRREAKASFGSLLGYPPCCIEFFLGFGDAEDNALWLRRTHAASVSGIDPLLSHYPFPFVSHIPCSFHCEPSGVIAAAALARLRAHDEEAAETVVVAQRAPLLFWDLDHWVRLDGSVDAYQEVFCGRGDSGWFRSLVDALRRGSAVRVREGEVLVRTETDDSAWLPVDVAAQLPPVVVEPRDHGPFSARVHVALLMLRPGLEGFVAEDFVDNLAGAVRDRGVPCRVLDVNVGMTVESARSALRRTLERLPTVDLVVFDRPPPRTLVGEARAVLPAARLCAQTTEACDDDCGLDAIWSCVDVRSAVRAIDALRDATAGPSIDLRSRTSARAVYPFPRPRPFLFRGDPADQGGLTATRRMIWHDPTCPYREGRTFDSCNFCASPHILIGPAAVGDPEQALLAQLRHLQRKLPDLREIILLDQRFMTFIRRLVARLNEAERPIDLLFQARSDQLLEHEEDLAAGIGALPAGFRLHLYLVGFESFSAAELRRLGKGITPEQNSRAIEAMDRLQDRSAGRFLFRARGAHGFILFNPWTEPDDLVDNIPYLRRHRFHEIRYDYLATRLRLLPGLPLYDRAKQEGLFDDDSQRAAGVEAFFRGYSPPRAWRFRNPETAYIWAALQEVLPGVQRGEEADVLERLLREAGHKGQDRSSKR